MARSVIGAVGLGALAACGAPQGGGGTAVPARALTVEGVAFSAEILPGPPGEVLTAAGARRVQGRSIRVQRADGVVLSNSDGRIAKAAAEAACDAASGRFNPSALGRYAGPGVWAFDGGCA